MSTFNWVLAIVTRDYTDEYLKLYRSLGVQTVLGTPASGTASRSLLHFLGLEASEKTILMCACGAETARKAKAGGGTIVHAKGTGTGLAEQFFGVKIASEKEMVLIVAKAEDRTPIMRAIMEGAGAATKAQAVVFSLPIIAVAGLSAFQEEPESSETADVSAPADGPADA